MDQSPNEESNKSLIECGEDSNLYEDMQEVVDADDEQVQLSVAQDDDIS